MLSPIGGSMGAFCESSNHSATLSMAKCLEYSS